MGLKVCCLTGFFHHCLTTMSALTHMHCYPLFESGTKTRLFYAENIYNNKLYTMNNSMKYCCLMKSIMAYGANERACLNIYHVCSIDN